MSKSQNFPCLSPFGVPLIKYGRFIDNVPIKENEKDGRPEKKREIPILLTHVLVPIFPLCLAVTHSLSQLPMFNPACDQNVNALFLD